MMYSPYTYRYTTPEQRQDLVVRKALQDLELEIARIELHLDVNGEVPYNGADPIQQVDLLKKMITKVENIGQTTVEER